MSRCSTCGVSFPQTIIPADRKLKLPNGGTAQFCSSLCKANYKKSSSR